MTKTSMTERVRRGRRIAATPGHVRYLTRELYAIVGDSKTIYLVNLADEKCECKDFEIHRHTCKHLVAVMIVAARATRQRSTQTLLEAPKTRPRRNEVERDAFDRAELKRRSELRKDAMVKQARVATAWVERMEAV